MKNCCVPVPTEQKKLLKVMTCLHKKYVSGKIPYTDAYFMDPSSAGYTLMITELKSIQTLLNGYLDANNIFDVSGTNVANINLWTATAEGIVAYDSDGTLLTNTFSNAMANAIYVNSVINNVGVLKTV